MQNSGGRRGSFRGGHFSSGGGSAVHSPSSRPYVDRSWHGAPDGGRGMPAPFRRHPYSPEGHFDGPHMGGHFDEPYFYDERDRTQGMKRPFDMRVSFSLFLFVISLCPFMILHFI